jgi:hypothetical protein
MGRCRDDFFFLLGCTLPFFFFFPRPRKSLNLTEEIFVTELVELSSELVELSSELVEGE